MVSVDRAVRRACVHLGVQETLIASAVGREAEGRRCQVVLVTDRRLLVVGRRGDAPTEFDPDDCRATFDRATESLSIEQAGRGVRLRDVTEPAARQVVTLVTTRWRSSVRWQDPPQHVRILAG